MLAASIRIDRQLERNIGRVIAADDRARTLGLERGGDAVGGLLEVPAVIHRLELVQIEAAGRIGQGSPAGEGMPARDRAAHGTTVRQYSMGVQCAGDARGPRVSSPAAARTDSDTPRPRSP